MSHPEDEFEELDLPERIRRSMVILAAQADAATRVLNEGEDDYNIGVSISAKLPGLTITVSWSWDKSGPEIEIN
jgi:hypothetical protein